MKRAELSELSTALLSLTVFRQLLADRVVGSLQDFLQTLQEENADRSVSAYCNFVARLYEANGGDLTAYVENICYSSENIYVKSIGAGRQPTLVVRESTERDLKILQKVAEISSKVLCEEIFGRENLPQFLSQKTDFAEKYKYRAKNIEKFGYGQYADNCMFYVDEIGKIIPAQSPDRISFEMLIGYEQERRAVIDNTKALLAGKPAANVLLTGDAGTGKSSTVKALENEFFNEGLRMIELRKDQLGRIPGILDELAKNPLKFILFVDDLSFSGEDDNFGALKAVLEGSVSARSHNVVIYATSNRRHMVKESFSDRAGDEVHRNDTIQELMSLSDRFGLHISFYKPDKATYLKIVCGLAQRNGIVRSEEELKADAERFALERGGRSARLAKQYIDSLMSET